MRREGAPIERWWFHALDGEIALAEGDPGRAASAFAAGEPASLMTFNRTDDIGIWTMLGNNLLLRDGIARTRAAQRRFDDAIGIYRRLLIKDRESKWTAMFEPRYVLELARLLDKAGQKDAARVEYRRFLNLWKNADAGLPELAEARQRVGSKP